MDNERASAKDFVEHWRWAADKGLMKLASAQSLVAACRRVLEVEENWESIDIRKINVDDMVLRFKNLNQKAFKPNSLKVYESRFRRAIISYRSYLEDPSSWSYASRRLASKGKASNLQTGQPPQEILTAESDQQHPGTQVYRYPFRPDFMAKLELPRDPTSKEVERLVAWARTLAVDYSPES